MDYAYTFRALSHASAIIVYPCVFLIFVAYLLKAIGLMKITKNLGEQNPWLAFIPVADMYLLGKSTFKEAWLAWALVILDVIHLVSPILSLVYKYGNNNLVMAASVFSLMLFILNYIALYKIYEKISNKAIIMLIFTVLTFGFIAPIFLFAIRNNPIREQEK